MTRLGKHKNLLFRIEGGKATGVLRSTSEATFFSTTLSFQVQAQRFFDASPVFVRHVRQQIEARRGTASGTFQPLASTLPLSICHIAFVNNDTGSQFYLRAPFSGGIFVIIMPQILSLQTRMECSNCQIYSNHRSNNWQCREDTYTQMQDLRKNIPAR
ncbi:MAG: hypothetical protein KGM99_11690 [Burkholderiales bacterium]|nr:hypothetical protein [Burkholderiales bacterium]